MIRRPRLLPVVAGVLLVSGIALMLASLRIEATSEPGVVGATPVAPALATPIVSTGRPGTSEVAATRLVTKAQTAQRTLSYHGVKEVSRWNGHTHSRVVVTVDHRPGRGTVVVAGEGESTVSAPAASVSDDTSDQTPLDSVDVLVRNYRLVSRAAGVVADRTADTVEAQRPDGAVAARFWVDRTTGLVLRRELYDPAGRTMESVSFTRVAIGASTEAPTASTAPTAPTAPSPAASSDPAPSSIASSTTPAVRWVTMRPGDVADLREEGWPIPANLEGGMTLYSLHEQAGSSSPVVQLGYTDGLVSISVFLQRGVLDRTALEGYVPLTVGAGQVWCRMSGSAPFYVWQSTGRAPAAAATGSADAASPRDIVVSATTESPSAPMAAVVTALAAEPTKPAHADGVGDRVSRGVHRVTSWFDPQR